MTDDRPALGIALMLGFCLVIPMGDALAKLLGSVVTIVTLLCVRAVMQAFLLYPVSYLLGQSIRVPRRLLGMIVYRTLLQMAGIWFMYTSLTFLPLADATAIAFVMPFIMLVLGKLVLNEEIGTRRVAACLVGFIGTLLVVQPSFIAVGAPALLPLGVAFTFAFFMLATRQVAKAIEPIALQALTGLVSCAVLLPLLIVGTVADIPSLKLTIPSPGYLIPLLAIGVLGTLAYLFMSLSLRYAPAATLAPMQYLEIPVATLYGLLIFGELPNGLAALGIVVTIAAGLYIVFRERSIARAKRAEHLTHSQVQT